jgi:hypothetical protein
MEVPLVSAAEALMEARAAGIRLDIDGDYLVLQAPAPPPPAVVEALSRHKADIVALLRPADDGWSAEDWQAFHDERAGRLEFDAGMPRPEAEAEAFEACVVEWLNRNPAPSPAGRCAWCGQLESESASIVPFGTEPGTHAWLHGECWRPWQAARRAEATKALSRIGVVSDAAQSEQT